MSCIHFIGGEKGGVGKSVTSRLLAQYFIDHSIEIMGFDADQSHQTLSRFYGQFCKPLNLQEFESTDQLVETALEKDVQVILDMPAQSQRFLTQWLEANDVVSLCEETDLQLVYWYVVDDGKDSLTLLKKVLEQYGLALTIVVVKNHGRGVDFSSLEALPVLNDELQPVVQMDLPALYANTMQKIDQLDINFWAAAKSKEAGLSVMERQRVKTWLKNASLAIDEVLSELD